MIESRYLTIQELRGLSGWSLSTIRRRVRDGSIPVIQPGGPRTRMLFPADVLDRLATPRIKPTDAIDTNHAVKDSPNWEEADQSLAGPMPDWMSGPLFEKINPKNP